MSAGAEMDRNDVKRDNLLDQRSPGDSSAFQSQVDDDVISDFRLDFQQCFQAKIQIPHLTGFCFRAHTQIAVINAKMQ